jgi:molybdopterin biosynthesis enzyme
MKCNVVAVGTELLLGQIVDTNSSYIGEQLAAVGIGSHLQLKVGDNLARVVAAIRLALEDADAVISVVVSAQHMMTSRVTHLLKSWVFHLSTTTTSPN